MQNGSYHKALVMSGYMIGSAIVALCDRVATGFGGNDSEHVEHRAGASDVTAIAGLFPRLKAVATAFNPTLE